MTTRPVANYDLYRGQTPSQTLGPFFHQGLVRTRDMFQVPGVCSEAQAAIGNVLVSHDTRGLRIRVEGVVYDGLGQPVVDALLEAWQADAEGRYDHPLDAGRAGSHAVFGFGRAPTDEKGRYYFETIKPGSVSWLGGVPQAPHLNIILGARGMARHAFTRIYFDSDPELAKDPILGYVPAERRHTLIARAAPAPVAHQTYHFDIHIQGENETVFFDV